MSDDGVEVHGHELSLFGDQPWEDNVKAGWSQRSPLRDHELHAATGQQGYRPVAMILFVGGSRTAIDSRHTSIFPVTA